MKHLFFTLCLIVIYAMGYSQNGGQYAENPLGKMSFTGHSNGYYHISRTNLQPCAVEIKIDWLDKDTTVIIAGNATVIINLPGAFVPHSYIKSRPLTNCNSGNGDMGWLEICSPDVLALEFKYFRASVVDNRIKIELSVTGTEDENEFNLRASFDGGRTFENVAVLLPFDGAYTLYLTKAKKPDGSTYFITSLK